MAAPWKNTKSTSIAKVIGRDPCWRKLHAESKNRLHKHGGKLTPNKETLNLQRKGSLEEGEETSTKIHCPSCSMDTVAGTIFCVGGAKRTNMSKKQEEASSKSLQEGFAVIRWRLRTKQSGATVRQGHGAPPESRYERCQHWKHQREKEVQLHHRQVGLGLVAVWTLSAHDWRPSQCVSLLHELGTGFSSLRVQVGVESCCFQRCGSDCCAKSC